MIILYIFLGLFIFGVTVWTFRITKHFLKANYKELMRLFAYIILIGAFIHGLNYLVTV